MIYWFVRIWYRNHNIVELISRVNEEYLVCLSDEILFPIFGFRGNNKIERTISMVKFSLKRWKYNYLFFNIAFIFPQEYVIWKLTQ